jgi:hypothetical protein
MSMRYFPHHKLIVLLIWLFTSYPLCLKANDTAVVQSIIKKAVSATSDDERTRAFIKVSEIYAGSNLDQMIIL